MNGSWNFTFLYPLLLALFTWFGLLGTFGPKEIVLGVLVGVGGALLANRIATERSRPKLRDSSGSILKLLSYFALRVLPTMVKDSVVIARIAILHPSKLKGGIIAVKLEDASEEALAVISYGVTLSPDRQVVFIDEENMTIYVHAMTPPDLEQVQREIIEEYNRFVRRATP